MHVNTQHVVGVVGWEPLVVNLGHCYRKQQRWDDAIQVYERALGLCPGQAGTYAALGFTRHLKVGSKANMLWHTHASLYEHDCLEPVFLVRAS